MREILFKAKREDNGEWVFGNLIHRTKYYSENTNNYFIMKIGEFDYDHYSEYYKVIPETISQYTGFKDKNGNKIFENDIVNVNKGHIDYVVFRCGCFCMARQAMFYEFTYQNENRIEVIGNVFDNKELLEEITCQTTE